MACASSHKPVTLIKRRFWLKVDVWQNLETFLPVSTWWVGGLLLVSSGSGQGCC